ncbi:VWA domain-containing protein [Planctomycetales bacterium]|nr:VWA domain-containing protein [Planctomycetales bacterium]
MIFLNPWAWGLLALAVPVIVFFLLKVKLRQERVSTTLFWQRIIEEKRTRRIWRKLRYPFSLLLCLLFLLLLTLAALNPVLTGHVQTVRQVIIIDNSGSMKALLPHSKMSRLESAKQKCLQHLTGGETAIITAGGFPGIICGFTPHAGLVRRAVKQIQPVDGRTAVEDAVKLAGELIAGVKDASILVYTDGCFSEQQTFADNVRFVPVAAPADNTAITAFQPRRTHGDSTGYEIFAECTHFGQKPVECRLEIERQTSNRWEIVDVFSLKLEPNGRVSKIVSGVSLTGGTFRATLKPDDILPADNVTAADLPDVPKQTVYFYGKNNFFLTQALQVQPSVDLQLIDAVPEKMPSDAVLVIYRTVPPKLPDGNIWIIDPHNGCELFRVGTSLVAPVADVPDKTLPLLNNVKLQDLELPGARQITVSDKKNWKIHVQTPDGLPLLMQFQSIFVLTADLNQGDLPLRTAFPLLVANVLGNFQKNGGKMLPEPAFCREESNLQEVNSAVKGTEQNTAAADFSAFFSQYPLWFYFTLAGLVLITAEWLLYQRRWIE